jgi:hypothetical protein
MASTETDFETIAKNNRGIEKYFCGGKKRLKEPGRLTGLELLEFIPSYWEKQFFIRIDEIEYSFHPACASCFSLESFGEKKDNRLTIGNYAL